VQKEPHDTQRKQVVLFVFSEQRGTIDSARAWPRFQEKRFSSASTLSLVIFQQRSVVIYLRESGVVSV
jgi:hypothetical protein